MALLVTFLIVCSATIASAGPAIVSAAQEASPCVRDSFRIPSWFVHDFHVDGTDASFHILNRATNYSAEISCSGLSRDLKSCSLKDGKNSTALHVAVSLDKQSAGISVNQSWVCPGKNISQPIKFEAAGNASTSMRQGNDTQARNSTDVPILIRGSLSAPVRISPVYATGPIGHDSEGCAAKAKSPSWVLEAVYYLNQTGDGAETSLPAQNLMLQIVNPEIGHQASCTGFLAGDLSPTPALLSCGGGNDPTGRDRYQITTDVLFEPATFRFTINQTWFCDDVDQARPVEVHATGSTILDLNCTTVLTPAKDMPEPWNTTSCYSERIAFNGSLASLEDLPPYSIEDPLPIPDGCTITSFLSPAWRLSNFEADGTSDAVSSSSVGFSMELEMPANQFQFPVDVMQTDIPATGGSTNSSGSSGWATCKFGPGQEPLAPQSCSFHYEGNKKDLSIKADWICADLDPDNPIKFAGTTTTTLPEVSCRKANGDSDGTRCETAVGRSWVAEISDVHYSQDPPEESSED